MNKKIVGNEAQDAQKDEIEMQAFYRASQRRHLKLRDLIIEHFTAEETISNTLNTESHEKPE